MELNPNSGLWEVTIKCFTDDLERGLANAGTGVSKLNDLNSNDARHALNQYITSHFQVLFNQTPMLLSYVGAEHEMDMTVVYFESASMPDLQTIQVTNTVLMELFDGQRNVVDVSMNGRTSTLVLLKSKPWDVIYR